MTVRILRWATGCVAAVFVALVAGGVALSYADRHLVPVSGWDFSSVFEEVMFMAIPAVGFVLASRRPGNGVGWIFLGAGLVKSAVDGRRGAQNAIALAVREARAADWSWDKISAALGGTPNGETLRRNFGGQKDTAS